MIGGIGKFFNKVTKVLMSRRVMNIVVAVLSLFVIVFVLRMVGLYEGMEGKKKEGMYNKKDGMEGKKKEGMNNKKEKKHEKKEAMENQAHVEEEGKKEEEEVEGTENFVPGPSMFDGKLGKKEMTKTKV